MLTPGQAGVRNAGRLMQDEGRVVLFRFRCAECAYGASAAEPPAGCPMCGGIRWTREGWRPSERLHADLRPPALAPHLADDARVQRPAWLAFRNLNEKIRWLQAGSADEQLDLVCECDNEHCFAPLSIGLPTYERVRREAELFLVLPGHEPPSLTEVVEVGRRYAVVRCKDRAALITEAEEPEREATGA